MVLVGGATRLTESGLSIVEWKPVTGTLPPLGEAAWQAEFDKYKTIPQFQQRNSAMTLHEFKTIFWWEWAHRLMGRVIGAAFLVPFLWFLAKGWIGPGLRGRLWAIFALGALQGAVGWWMVASGLADRLEVSQYRLATHLILACVIFAATLWTALRLAGRATIEVPARVRASAIGLLALALLQIYLGALVAGLRAGLIYNTWPLIDGSFMPGGVAPAARHAGVAQPVREHPHGAVQPSHGGLCAAGACAHPCVRRDADRAAAPRRSRLRSPAPSRCRPALGIMTLLQQVPISLALAHQAGAIVVLALAVAHAQRIAARSFRNRRVCGSAVIFC